MVIVYNKRLLKILLVLAALGSVILFYFSWPTDDADRAVSIQPETRSQMPADPQAAGDHQIKALAKALAQKPGHTPVLLQLAKLESEKGLFSDAARHLQEIVGLEPDNADAKLELGKVFFQQGNIQGALEQMQEILKKHPAHPDALYNLGAIYGNLGNSDRALEYWRRLIALDPGSESGKLAQQMLPRLQTKDR